MKAFDVIHAEEMEKALAAVKDQEVALTRPEDFRGRDAYYCSLRADLMLKQFMKNHANLLVDARELSDELLVEIGKRVGFPVGMCHRRDEHGDVVPVVLPLSVYAAAEREARNRASERYYAQDDKP